MDDDELGLAVVRSIASEAYAQRDVAIARVRRAMAFLREVFDESVETNATGYRRFMFTEDEGWQAAVVAWLVECEDAYEPAE